MSTKRIGLVLVAATLVLAACGRFNDEGGSTGASGGATGPSGIEHPTGADDLVLRVEYQGGFVPYEFMLKRVPAWSLYGDGTVIVEGPVIEIYPGPALPNLLAFSITEEGIQAILEAAQEAGLMDGDATYGYPCIADAADTVFTTNAGGSTSVVSAYALEFADPALSTGGDCPDVDTQARAKLAEFQRMLGDLRSWLPGPIGPEEPYTPTEMRTYVLPYRGQDDLQQSPIEWPLSQPLVAFGDPVPDGNDIRCGVVSGDDLAELLPLAEQANELTPWTSGGEEYQLIFRPLLPDEHGC
ncbi:MAG TPA: hypothetical protein VIC58_10265 [Actinomycetota bacterium]|jgi:hypothetical protein